jgi:hypothetical protein
MHHLLSSFVSTVSQLWKATAYHPERHYMRGPGPKWREKHQMRLVTPLVICAGVILLGTGTVAQVSVSSPIGDKLQPCMAVTDEMARLTCYDKAIGRPPTPPAKGPLPPPLTHPADKQRS